MLSIFPVSKRKASSFAHAISLNPSNVKYFFSALLLAVAVGFGHAQTTVTLNVADNGSSPWTVPAGVTSITVKLWGGGGGSGGHGTASVTAGGNGVASTFEGGYSAGGGFGSLGALNNTPTAGGAGGTASGGTTNTNGSTGTIGTVGTTSVGGNGGASPNGGALQGGATISTNPSASAVGVLGNFPGGGAGGSARSGNAGNTANRRSTGGGGGGAYVEVTISVNPGDEFDYVVGAGGAAGAGNQAAGGAGANGRIEITYTAAPSCSNATLTQTSAAGTEAQTICFSEAMVDLSYNVANATGATISGGALPNGVTGVFTAGVYTVSGTPLETGTFTVTITTTGATAPCTEASVVVSISVPQPEVTGITGTTPLCIGATTTYTATGVVLAGGTGYWQSSNTNVATVDVNTGLVTAVGAGTCNIGYYIYRIFGNCSTSASALQSLTVTPSAAVTGVTGTTPLCIGATATYTANGVVLGGGAGAWSSSNELVATVNPTTGLVTAVGAGTCNIIYTITGGCVNDPVSAQQSLTVTPSAAVTSVTGTTPLCIGATATYSATGVELGGGTGAWSTSDANVATVNAGTGEVTAIGAGTCNIIYTITGGCINDPVSAQQSVTVYNLLTSGTIASDANVTLCEGGNPLTFSAAAATGGDGNYSYQWEESAGCTGTWVDATAQDAVTNTLSFNPPALSLVGDMCYRLKITDGCGTEAFSTTKTYTVVADPEAHHTIIPGSGQVCVGESVSATFSGASGGTGTVVDVYEFSTNGGGTWAPYTPGDPIVATAGMVGTTQIRIRTRRTATGTGCDFSPYNIVQWNVHALPTMSCPTYSDVCLNAASFALSGATPGGGTYSGPGVSGGNFDPATAGVGTHTITYTATDGNGCSNTCTFDITVNDLPTMSCPADFNICVSTGTFALSGATPGGGTYSGTGVSGGNFDPATAGVGTHTISYTVTDGNGCSNSCSFDITVVGLPSFTSCPSNITQGTDLNLCTSVVVNYTATATDNIGGSPFMQYTFDGVTTGSGVGTGSGSTFAIGVTNVTVTATSGCGTTSCTFTVTVADNQPPTAICQNITVFLNASGTAIITPGMVDNGSSDACGIGGSSASPAVFDCADVGANNVTLTVSDINGNSGTCNAIVTVLDNTFPTAICQNFDLYLDLSGNGTLSPNDINNNSTDNCSVTGLALSKTAFTTADAGANTVTMTVSDASGNTSTCNAVVTVYPCEAYNVTQDLCYSGAASIQDAWDNAANGETIFIPNGDYVPQTFIATNAKDVTITWGGSPGCVASGDIDWTAQTVQVEVDGTTVCTQYDQWQVTGTVTLGNADLDLVLGYAPTAGDAYTIVLNDAADLISGTFNGLAEGATFTATFMATNYDFIISYVGGSGNDVVLTATSHQYEIVTAGNIITVTDIAGNGETIAISENGANIRFDVAGRNYSLNGGPGTAFPIDIALAGVSGITVTGGDGNDIINVGAFTAALPSLTLNGGTGDDAVNFNGDIAFATDANLDVNMQDDDATPGTDQVTFAAGANVTVSGVGTADIMVSRNIAFNSGSSLETEDGDLTLEANQQATPSTGNFIGVNIDGASVITSGSGVLTVLGKGGDTSGSNYGVNVSSGSISGGSGTVNVEGNGGQSTSSSNYGVYVLSSGQISSTDGDITVTGTSGGSGVSSQGIGIRLQSAGIILAGGTANVTVTGNGCSACEGPFNRGIVITGTNSGINTTDGDIFVSGIGGGTGSGAANYGVDITGGGQILAGGTGSVTVTGNGGLGSTGGINYGVGVNDANSRISSTDGNVTVTGIGGGTGSSALNLGVYVTGGGQILAGGTGNVTVTGNGGTGAGGDGNRGVYVKDANSRITSTDGDVTVEGTGGGTGASVDNHGVHLFFGGQILAVGTGNVTVTGNGGTGSTGNANYGVFVRGTNAAINTNGGSVSVVGTGGGTVSSQNNFGVSIEFAGQINAGGTGTVSVTGYGSTTTGGSINPGVRVLDANSRIQSNNGDVTVTGTGGGQAATGSSANRGVIVQDGAQVLAGGTASVTVTGSGCVACEGNENFGVFVTGANAKITSTDGNVTVDGTGGGTSTSASNYGTVISNQGEILAGGTGNVTVTGNGGTNSSGIENFGVYVTGTNSRITSSGGNVEVSGNGGGSGASANNFGVYLIDAGQILAGGTGNVTVTGNGGTGTNYNHYGIYITGTDSRITSSGGDVDVIGTGGGTGGSGDNAGVRLISAGQILAGGTGNVTVSGYGGTGSTGPNNHGITIAQTNSRITSSGGNVEVTGTGGGSGASFENFGVYLVNNGQLLAGGTGNVSVIGNGGSNPTGNSNFGVYVEGTNSRLTSTDGDVSVEGQGGGSGASLYNYGVYVRFDGQILAGGTGNVTVTGNGGTGASGNENHGIFVTGTNSRITSTDGDVSVEGIGGGSGASTNNHGVRVASSGQITAGGTGMVTVNGTGGLNAQGVGNLGVYATNSGQITSNDGDVIVTGQGGGAGPGGSNFGINLDAQGQILAGGTGNVTVTGDGGSTTGLFNFGVHLNGANTRISSSGGNVEVYGEGAGTGSSALNYGVVVSLSSEISAGGTGSVTVEGIGALNAEGIGNHGVYVSTSSVITSSGGAVSIDGQGGGTSTSASNIGVIVESAGRILAGGSGNLTISGNGSNSATGLTNIGVYVNGTNSEISSNGGAISITGIEGTGSNGLGIITNDNGVITTATNGGDVVLTTNSIDIRTTTSVASDALSSVTIKPYTAGVEIDLGSATDPIGGPMSLSNDELNRISGGSVILGDATSGEINVTAAITYATPTDLALVSEGDVTLSFPINTNGGNLLLDPGPSPAAVYPYVAAVDVTVNELSFGSDLAININGPVANVDHTQLSVVGSVDLTGVDLVLTAAYAFFWAEEFVIVDNDGVDPVIGQFNQADTIWITSLGELYGFDIIYDGGDGNDVVLKVGCSPITDAQVGPTITCPASQQIFLGVNQCTVNVSWLIPTPVDNCSIDYIQVSADNNGNSVFINEILGYHSGTFNIGVTTITYETADAEGNMASCSFNITVTDNNEPSIGSVPSPITINVAPGSCERQVFWTPPVISEACVGLSVVASHTPGAFFPIGTTTVSYFATDGSGNTNYAEFDITVVDNEAPALTGTAYAGASAVDYCAADANANAVADFDDVNALMGYTDNSQLCTPAQSLVANYVSHTVTGDDCSWTRTYTFEVEDESSNTILGSYSDTGSNQQPPAFVGPGYSTTLTNACIPTEIAAATTFVEANALVGYEDACGSTVGLTATQVGTTVTGDNCNWTVTFEYMVTDACGNTLGGQTYSYDGEDLTAPTGTPPTGTDNINACFVDGTTPPTGTPAFDAMAAALGYNDNCTGNTVLATLTNTTVTGDNCAWTVTYTFTVADNCGNTLGGQTIQHTGGDKTAPTGTAPMAITGIDDCPADAVANNGFNAAYAAAGYSDACGGAVTAILTNTELDPNAECGWTITYTFAVADACNNSLMGQSYTVSGSNQSIPVLATNDNCATLNINNVNECLADAATWDATVLESSVGALYESACGSTGVTATLSGTLPGQGNTDCMWSFSYEFTLVDQCGNSTTCAVTRSGGDTELPSFTVPADITIYVDANCNYDADTSITGDVTDESGVCGSEQATYTDNVVAGACVGSWVITRTWSLVDNCANSTYTADQTITVLDEIAPSIVLNTPISALNFDGVDDHVGITGDISSLTDFSIEAWVNPSSHNNWARILDYGNGAGFQVLLAASIGTSGRPRFSIHNGGVEQIVDSPDPIPLNTWTHITGTLEGTVAKLYINGVLVAQNNNFGLTPADLGPTATNWLGRSHYVQDAYFNGSMDDIRIWSAARSEAEILANMNSCLVGNEANLVSYYRFEDGTGSTIITDLGPAANNGTLVNMDANTDWVEGSLECAPSTFITTPLGVTSSYALNFAGGNQYVSVANPTQATNNFTLEGWVKPADTTGQYVLFHNGLTVNNGYGIDMYPGGSLRIHYAGVTFLNPNVTIPINQWSHLALVMDNGLTKFFYNGNLVYTNASPGFTSTPSPTFSIAGQSAANYLSHFIGDIDEVRLWTVPRSDNDILSAMNTCLNGNETGLACYFNFEDGPGSSTVTDASGNGNNTVLSNMDPNTDWVQGNTCTSSYGFHTVYLDANGQYNLTIAELGLDATDNCSNVAQTLSETNFDCSDIANSPITITYTATDECGNSSTLAIQVIVLDTLAPVLADPQISCSDLDSLNLDWCLSEIEAFDAQAAFVDTLMAIYEDNCALDTAILHETIVTLGGNNCWQYEYVFRIYDEYNNYTSCMITFSGGDSVPPTFTPPADTTIYTTDLGCFYDANPLTIGSLQDVADNCYQYIAPTSGFTGDFAPSNWTLSLGANASGSGAVTATEATLVSPNAGGGASQTTLCVSIPYDGTFAFDWNYTTTDVGSNWDPFGYSVNGNYTQLTNNALSAQSGSASIALSAGDEFCFVQRTVDGIFGSSTSISNMFVFSPDGLTPSHNDVVSQGPCEGSWIIERTWSVSDECGNATTHLQTITVSDSTRPSFTVPADTILYVDNMCMADTSVTAMGDVTDEMDNCTAVVNATYSDSVYTICAGIFEVYRTWHVEDDCGNVNEQVQFISVLDTLLPAPVSFPNDQFLQASPTVCGVLTSFQVPVFDDNCGIASIVATAMNGNTGVPINDIMGTVLMFVNLGTTVVSYTVTDNCGNSMVYSFDIVVSDLTPPVITSCPANFVVNSDPGDCGAQVFWLGPLATDNCGTVTLTVDPIVASGSVFPVGVTNVVYTATDGSGLTSTCGFSVTVNDNEDPTITCPQDVVVSADAGECFAALTAAVLGTPTTNDNCGVASVTSDFVDGNISVGSYTITWTVTDIHGNSSTCEQTLTVEDNEAPSLACPANVTVTTDAGECFAALVEADLGMPVTGDNCGVATTTSNFVDGNIAVGIYTYVWTTTDIHGNVSTCEQTLTVEDNEAPSLACPSNVTVTADAGQCYAALTSAILGTPTTGDNCGVATTVSNFVDGNISVGTHTYVWTVTDIHGNVSTCEQSVTVVDTEAPSITCAVPAASYNTDPMACDYTVPDTHLDPTMTDDNCGVASVTNDYNASSTLQGAAFPVGTTTVIWTVTDVHGNSSTCEQTIEVVNNNVPDIACLLDQNEVFTTGFCGYVVVGAEFDPGVTVACGSTYTIENDINNTATLDGELFGEGTTTVTWTIVVDGISTYYCVYDVTVEGISAIEDVVRPVCDQMDGEVTITPQGGTAPYTIVWSDMSTSFTRTGLMDGSYDYTIFDAISCSYSGTVVVNEWPCEFQLECGTTTVASTEDETGWVTVGLTKTFINPVVIATVVTANKTSRSYVTRVRNAGPSSFELMVQAADPNIFFGPFVPDNVSIYYLVVEEGIYIPSVHNVKAEAMFYNSTQTARKNNWAIENVSYNQSYTNPVVVGQVMSWNPLDTAWSVFWSNGGSQRSVPTAAAMGIGKHVAEDGSFMRTDETLGYLVIEMGTGTAVDGEQFYAGRTAQMVSGLDEANAINGFPQYVAQLSGINCGVCAQSGMYGNDGAWPTFYNQTAPFVNKVVRFVSLEDQIGDGERSHKNPPEQVSYILFGTITPKSDEEGIPEEVEFESYDELEIRPTVILYPNPASAEVTISINNETSSTAMFTLTNMMGQVISMEEVNLSGASHLHTMDVSYLAEGVYMLTYDNGTFKSTIRFVKH